MAFLETFEPLLSVKKFVRHKKGRSVGGYPMDQKVYSCCYNILTITQTYNSKNTPIARFHAVKIAKSAFLYVFTMAFPTSPLGNV